MKRFIGFIFCLLFSLVMGELAHAEWVPVANLSQKIPFQSMKYCKYRVNWQVTSTNPSGTGYFSVSQDGFYEQRNPATGVPFTTGQEIYFAFDESVLPVVWSSNAQSQTPYQAINALLNGDSTARIVGMGLAVPTNITAAPRVFVAYRNQSTANWSSAAYLTFQVTAPSNFILERECVYPTGSPSPSP